MKVIVLAPHNDDETLFTCFNALRYNAHVVVCLRSHVQELRGTGITAEVREEETARAMDVLGLDWTQWPFGDGMSAVDTGLGTLDGSMEELWREHRPEVVFAPAVEEGGHHEHNVIGELASRVFGDAYRPYLTYRRGFDRSYGERVEFEPHWPILKLRALACYESQIQEPSCRDWFLGEQWEYVPTND